MKVLCVIDSLGSGGAQRQLVNIACGLKERGHEVEIFAYYPGDHFRPQLDQAGIPVRVHVKSSRFSLSAVSVLRRCIRRGRFTAVLAFLETPAVYAELACLGLRGVRLVVGERCNIPGRRASVGRIVKSHLHRLSRVVVTNSRSQQDWLAISFPFLASRLHCIWNGVDTGTFAPAQERASTPGETRLLGVGRVAFQKNLLNLAHALRTCTQSGVSVTVDWVGHIDDLGQYKLILKTVEDCGLAKSWRWFDARRDVPDLMQRYDALISPSIFEGLPNVICEALASGLPVLASDVADNALLIQDGQSGFLFAANDVPGMAAAIVRLSRLTNEQRAAMGSAGRAFALRELSLTKCVDAYEAVLGSVPRRQSTSNQSA